MIAQQFFASDIVIILMVLWVLPWKGVALWKAAKRGERGWFIVFLILNTLALLEIIYLFVIIKRNPKQDGERDTTPNEPEKPREPDRTIFQN